LLLAAHAKVADDVVAFTPPQREKLRSSLVHGVEFVDGTARLAAMILLLHGAGDPRGASLIVKDSSSLRLPNGGASSFRILPSAASRRSR